MCQRCFLILPETITVESQRRNKNDDARAMSQIQMERMTETDKLPAYALALYIQNDKTPLVIYLTEPVVLGRAGATTQQMHLDLSPYNAAQMGVSRQHALFRRGDNVTIEDMSSTNGTWLNGTLLQPYQAAVIHSGDELKLARLEMEVYIPD